MADGAAQEIEDRDVGHVVGDERLDVALQHGAERERPTGRTRRSGCRRAPPGTCRRRWKCVAAASRLWRARPDGYRDRDRDRDHRTFQGPGDERQGAIAHAEGMEHATGLHCVGVCVARLPGCTRKKAKPVVPYGGVAFHEQARPRSADQRYQGDRSEAALLSPAGGPYPGVKLLSLDPLGAPCKRRAKVVRRPRWW